MKTKQRQANQIADLQRQLREALAGQAHVYHFADAQIGRAHTSRLMGSGVVLTLMTLGGGAVFEPVLIRDGLSDEAIAALRADFRRSYELATVFKPKGETA